MCNIPHAYRRAGRYVFRRRLHFREIISRPLSLALGTADPRIARLRAAMLSARFTTTKAGVDAMLEEGRTLTGIEIEALFRSELEQELRFYVHSAYEDASWSSSVPEVAAQEAEAYKIIRRPDRRLGLTDRDRADLTERGLGADIEAIEGYARQIRDLLTDDVVAARLAAVGAPVHPGTIAVARTHLIRAAASACTRVQKVFDDEVMDAADPIAALMADLGPPSPPVQQLSISDGAFQSAAPVAAESQFQVYDARRFSAVIGDVLAELKAEGTWSGDVSQQRRIMMTFAWITGDKPLGAYNHLDAAAFKRGLLQLPKRFYYGSLTEGAMSRPFADVIAELPALLPSERRNHKTVNRDMSTMSTVARHLAATSWKPRVLGATVMDFGVGRIAISRDPDIDTRPPWTTAHLKRLFSSPLYIGGGGALLRLRDDVPIPQVWHDAAYFAPLLSYYHHTCREETCGLEVADIGDRIMELANLFRQAESSSKDIIGLWGELFIMTEAASKENAARRWCLHRNAKYDFVSEGFALEVKATVRPKREHRFSLEQLRPLDALSVYVASVQLVQTQGGKAVFELMDEILAEIGDSDLRSAFLGLCLVKGGEGIYRSSPRYQLLFRERGAAFFSANEIAVPAVDANAPISNVTFDVSLDAVTQLSESDGAQLMRELSG